ncbi:GGDEF domain-containing protein [Magnetospirillum molischianum]|uniref:diguanylate cyclase n=1 Tax=Magnetospirillum molischianum DSM 120 TaxID=1150626 RepID=H8FWJ7_MAGML|nr:GGDEF domain-containing protein [Magnetospirillum molischianum]CCG42735.1 putative Diguanylate cyclase [Magnetospirillum molischianum DSM 120]
MRPLDALFGQAAFGEGEEYRKFQYRFTLAILMFSAVVTAIFHLSVHHGLAQSDPTYLNVSRAFLAISVVFYIVLRGHPARLGLVAWTYAVLALGLHLTTFHLNSPDELRIVWVILNLAGVYLVLGPKAGIAVTVISVVAIVATNPLLPHPYSPSAVVTFVMAMIYLSAFFHSFTAKSISFHHAMVEANRRLAEMADHDPLTGLYNARAYYRLCDATRHQAQRTGSPVAMLFVDLDHFKKINDQHGHEAGDAVLRATAQCLRTSLRQSDLVGRIGGEEFSITLPDTPLDAARRLAEKLREDIEALMPDIGATRLKITASIGVAADRKFAASVADLQRQADEAMYVAKRQGRNRVTYIDDIPVTDPA